MRFDIITIFPEVFERYFASSILKRAQEKSLIKLEIHNLRNWASDKHKSVDDKPYGGGPGMLLKVEPISKAIAAIKRKKRNLRPYIILFSAKGKQFNQRKARTLSKKQWLILICGRYEGVDERVAKYIADEELSVGPYVLTGGEVPAMVVVDAVSRLTKGVLGNKESEEQERYGYGLPQYTRPESLVIGGRRRRVPKVLLSGNHKKINDWRRKNIKASFKK
jgi:tRNA (guanine37-N1)-methyltransferase